MEFNRFKQIFGWGILVLLVWVGIYAVTGGFVADSSVEVTTRVEPTATEGYASQDVDSENIRIAEKDGMMMVFVPAGEFLMGSEFGDGDETPVHPVRLDAFWIDQTEVTNAMFALFVNDTSYQTDAEKVGKSYIYQNGNWEEVRGADWQHPLGVESNLDGLEQHPVAHMSWNDANVYCAWANRRLPTAAEWEKAARGVDGRRYPWGDPINAEYLNFDGVIGKTVPVGSYPAGASPYGALDMAGNLWEWVADWYVADYYEKAPVENPTGPESGQFRELRGGSWGNSSYNTRTTDRNFNSPNYTFVVNGFRCAVSP